MNTASTLARLLAAIVVTGAVTASASARADTITIATMAPKSSLWGKVFGAWSKAVNKKTNGKLVLKFYWNATQGDETTTVAKMRSGQLDGATLGASGLGKIHKPALALALPGLLTTWRSVDQARAAIYPELKTAFDKKGFYLSSIGDVGRARTLSKGRAIRTPDDIKGMKPAGPRQGLIAPVMFSVLGVTPVPTSLPELLPALSSGRINLMVAPALAAEQLQWAPYFDHIAADVSGIAVGAMVLSKKRLDAQPEDVLEVLRKTGKKAGQLLRARIRKEDDAAYRRLAGRMTVVTLTASEKASWAKVAKEVRRRLSQSTFPADLVARLEAAAAR
ncbi:MAG: hypothetical protein DRI90_16745 [Deltaproteobacteria bacterium]|nr:MAG: hypothetical protein DRI90_16745 [Deltaproteobacteria bacterium]